MAAKKQERNGKGQFTSAKTREKFEKWADAVHNAATTRSRLIQQLTDPRRDIDDECGYPDAGNITAKDYQDLYDRFDIAARVVEILPDECWQEVPSLVEDEDPDTETEFEKAWAEVGHTLRGRSFSKGENDNPMWEYLHRMDRLCGVGRYGVMLLGLNDGLPLEEPVAGYNEDTGEINPTKGAELTFVRVFTEHLAEISANETRTDSPRFGQPVTYNLSFYDASRDQVQALGLDTRTVRAHWTRVVHFADNLGSNEILGVPRMQTVYNRLYDLRKLLSGSGEMYWRGALPGLSLETHPQLGGDVAIDTSAMRGQMEQYMNGLQRYLSLMGMSAKSLAPQVVDPSPQVDVQLTAICIRLGIPKRIFMGSERGELASSQDIKTHAKRVRRRQVGFVTPRVINPVVDRLIMYGVLPEPSDGYSVSWPELMGLDEVQESTIGLQRTQALAQYVSGDVESVIPPLEYLTSILGIEAETAEAMIDAAMAATEKMTESDDPMEGFDDGFQDENEEEAGFAGPQGNRPDQGRNKGPRSGDS